MIPVFQSRHSTEEIGDCFEACVASILELPLFAVPGRSSFVELEGWRDTVREARARGGEQAVADLEVPASYGEWDLAFRRWLADRGLAWLELDLRASQLKPEAWLELAADTLPGYWIGVHRLEHGHTSHAVVYRGVAPAHNPHRGVLGLEGLGVLVAAHVLVAGDPPLIVRELGPELLPKVPTPLQVSTVVPAAPPEAIA